MTLKSSATAFDELAARLAEYDEALEATSAEMTTLKKQVFRVDMERTDSVKIVAECREQSEQRIVRLNVLFVRRNREQKFIRSLMTESVNAIYAVGHKLGHDTVNILQQCQERASVTVRVPFPVVLTHVSGMSATRIHCECEGSGDNGESKPAKGRPSEAR